LPVEIINVERKNGKAVSVVAEVDDIRFYYERGEKGKKPVEKPRVPITGFISKTDYQKLQDTVKKIFKEDRSKKRSLQPQLL